jgi:DNA-binding MarR family transcriptional regulator
MEGDMVSAEAASNLIDTLRGLVRHARVKAARSGHLGMLPPPLGALLSHVSCTEGHRPSTVAEDLRVTQSALSRQIAQAEALGYVARSPDPLDGRATLLSLTDAGAEALRVHREAQLDWAVSMMSDWTDEEVRDLTDRLGRLRDAASVGPVSTTR